MSTSSTASPRNHGRSAAGAIAGVADSAAASGEDHGVDHGGGTTATRATADGGVGGDGESVGGDPHQELEMVVIPTAKGEQLSFSHRRRQAPPPQQQAAGEKAETNGEDEPPRGSSGAGHRAGAPYSRGGATKKSPRLTRALSTRGLTTLANERRALSLLYARLGGDGWTRHDNWLSDEPLSEWQGVQCDSKTGRVRRLYLSHIGLVGMLYDGILAPCQQLRILDLSHNPDIDGALPASLMAMKRLTLVDVSHTGLDFVPPNMYETGAKVVAPFEIFLEGHTADDVSAQPTHCTYRCTHKACVH